MELFENINNTGTSNYSNILLVEKINKQIIDLTKKYESESNSDKAEKIYTKITELKNKGVLLKKQIIF